jgi:hypothetical protein
MLGCECYCVYVTEALVSSVNNTVESLSTVLYTIQQPLHKYCRSTKTNYAQRWALADYPGAIGLSDVESGKKKRSPNRHNVFLKKVCNCVCREDAFESTVAVLHSNRIFNCVKTSASYYVISTQILV